MIVSEKSHQNLSDYIIVFILTFFFNLIKTGLFHVKKREIHVIKTITIIKIHSEERVSTRSSEKMYDPSRYTGIYI